MAILHSLLIAYSRTRVTRLLQEYRPISYMYRTHYQCNTATYISKFLIRSHSQHCQCSSLIHSHLR